MNKKFIKIDMQAVAKLNENEMNVLVGGNTGVWDTIKDILGSLLDIEINPNCNCGCSNTGTANGKC